MKMHLDDRQVLKHFGKRPDLGKPIKGFVKKVTVGVRWSLPRGQHEPDDNVLVPPTVALKCVRRGLWEVNVEDQYREQIERWLLDNCQKAEHKNKPRSKRVAWHTYHD